MGPLGVPELVIILVIVVLLFGAKRLPGTAQSLGQSMKIFKKSIRDDETPAPADSDPRPITAAAEPVQPKRVADSERVDPDRAEH